MRGYVFHDTKWPKIVVITLKDRVVPLDRKSVWSSPLAGLLGDNLRTCSWDLDGKKYRTGKCLFIHGKQGLLSEDVDDKMDGKKAEI